MQTEQEIRELMVGQPGQGYRGPGTAVPVHWTSHRGTVQKTFSDG